jgi:hypothetical protein
MPQPLGDMCSATVSFVNWCLPPQDGWTPLHCASRGGHTAVVELLLQLGADAGAQDKVGRPPTWQQLGRTQAWDTNSFAYGAHMQECSPTLSMLACSSGGVCLLVHVGCVGFKVCLVGHTSTMERKTARWEDVGMCCGPPGLCTWRIPGCTRWRCEHAGIQLATEFDLEGI